jgi:hypothetical protein
MGEKAGLAIDYQTATQPVHIELSQFALP